ncbi:MAP3K7 C-terminal-like protein isoform X1 [Panthera uncia]|uniref:MAP3K7 C-terminal-like protein isoform X1 n=1 Tax=Panthera uncia TaxID=29064 RepID=UPI0020FF9FA8|nr:MAP3K7 C-terminal-like protein isoform X1 [Panthera uncia]
MNVENISPPPYFQSSRISQTLSNVDCQYYCPVKNLSLKNISRAKSFIMYSDTKKWTDFFLLLFVKPLPPCHDSVESMQVFKQHCQIAEEYNEVKKEIALLEERKKELIAKLDQAEKEKVDAAQLAREFEVLMEENRTLKLAQSQCVEQLEKLRIQYQKRQGSS